MGNLHYQVSREKLEPNQDSNLGPPAQRSTT